MKSDTKKFSHIVTCDFCFAYGVALVGGMPNGWAMQRTNRVCRGCSAPAPKVENLSGYHLCEQF